MDNNKYGPSPKRELKMMIPVSKIWVWLKQKISKEKEYERQDVDVGSRNVSGKNGCRRY